MAIITVINGDLAGTVYALDPASATVIGRNEECQIALEDVAGISRRHAEFSCADGTWSVTDLGSSNGIYVNNRKVRQHELTAEDILWLGQLQLRFTLADGEAAPAAPTGELNPETAQAVARAMAAVEAEFSRLIVGQKEVCELLLSALLANGHCLMVGLPGLGKTLMVRTLSDILDLGFNRIQFTPDLMPTDIIGSDVLDMDEESGRKSFRFIHGPIFTNLLLADEINRTPPKTQAALLEAMQERQVTAANQRFELPRPFFVLATQNPLEQEGTYPLPEAQMDRFMYNIIVDYPDEAEEEQIVRETTSSRDLTLEKVMHASQLLELQRLVRDLPVSDFLVKFATRLTRASRPGDRHAPEFIREHVSYGAGPRAAQFLVLGAKTKALLSGRLNVSCDDVRHVAPPILRHRIFTNFTADSEGITPDDLIERLLSTIKEPAAGEY